MTVKLTDAEFNHLWRLVGWVRLEIGPSPEEHVAIVRDIAPQLQDISEEGQARLVERHQRLASVPKYVRAAVKQLTKAMHAQQALRPKKRPPADVIEPPALPTTKRRSQ